MPSSRRPHQRLDWDLWSNTRHTHLSAYGFVCLQGKRTILEPDAPVHRMRGPYVIRLKVESLDSLLKFKT